MNYYKSALHKIRTALTLSPGDWSIFIQAWIGLLMVDLLLRSRPFPRVQQFVAQKQLTGKEFSPTRAWERIRYYQRFVRLAARYHLYPMTCLRQALTLQKMLAGQGIPSLLRFGVRKSPDQFLAHAWLEYAGQSIEFSHPGAEPYQPLTSLEGKP